MTLSNVAATIQADSLANFFRAKRPDLKLTPQIIKPILQNTGTPSTAQTSPALVIAAAWVLAEHLAEHRGRWATFGKLPEVIEHMTNTSADLARPGLANWSQNTPNTSSTETPAPCPAHPWAPARNCSPCYSEIKAGERPADAYGAKTYPNG